MNYFIVLYKDVGANRVQLPDKFVRQWGSTLENPLSMSSSNNVPWRVEVTTEYGNMWLGRGWSAFATDYNVGHKDAILFEYMGRGHFFVTFFNASAVEKPHPMRPLGDLPVNFFTVFMSDEYFDRLRLPKKFKHLFGGALTNPIRIYLDDVTSWRVKWIDQGSHIWFTRGWADLVAKCGIRMRDFLLFELRRKDGMYMKIARGEGQQILITRPSMHGDVVPLGFDEVTLWTSKITNSTASGKQPLYIPSDAVKQWFSGKPVDLSIMLPSGVLTKWNVIWYQATVNKRPRPNQCHFGVGWYQFVSSTTLPVGRKIRFFKRMNEDFIRFEVTNMEV